jgi:ribosomal protein S14
MTGQTLTMPHSSEPVYRRCERCGELTESVKETLCTPCIRVLADADDRWDELQESRLVERWSGAA